MRYVGCGSCLGTLFLVVGFRLALHDAQAKDVFCRIYIYIYIDARPERYAWGHVALLARGADGVLRGDDVWILVSLLCSPAGCDCRISHETCVTTTNELLWALVHMLNVI